MTPREALRQAVIACQREGVPPEDIYYSVMPILADYGPSTSGDDERAVWVRALRETAATPAPHLTSDAERAAWRLAMLYAADRIERTGGPPSSLPGEAVIRVALYEAYDATERPCAGRNSRDELVRRQVAALAPLLAASPQRGDDGLAYVREHYGVPAYLGVEVVYDGLTRGVVVGASGPHVLVSVPGIPDPLVCHPTYQIDYRLVVDKSDLRLVVDGKAGS